MKKYSSDKRLQVAKNMPSLKHTQDGQEYSFEKSDVMKWIASNEQLMNYVFDLLKQNKLIRYDEVKKTWVGVDHKERKMTDA